MKVPFEWLKEYIDLDIGVNEIAELLTLKGLEVSGISQSGTEIQNVVVGEVLAIKKHPQIERLYLCQVSDGKQIYPVVCGAPNVRTKQKVALARAGAFLPGGRKINKVKIQGEVSFGMLCSEKELGVGPDDKGIMVLSPKVRLGEDIKKIIGLAEPILEVELPTNRSDCASIYGIAREINAILTVGRKKSFLKKPIPNFYEGVKHISELISIEIHTTGCKRYIARVIENVKVGSSPSWLVNKLKLVGIRSVNNVVDITNYVLVELGHPLHAFDYNKINGKKIIVREARHSERLLLLDGKERSLASTDLVIADQERPIALAGIMGGENSSVTESTTNILLESAYFSPEPIRKTCRRLSIETESSYRFERGVDIKNLSYALDRAVSLIQKLAGGEVAKSYSDIYPVEFGITKVTLSKEKVTELLGIEISIEEIETILKALKFKVFREENILIVEVPSYRNDIKRQQDLIEEIARLYGYDRIPVEMPTISLKEKILTFPEKKIKQFLINIGLQEAISYSLVSVSDLEKLMIENQTTVDIVNPLSHQQNVLRPTLMLGLINIAKRNIYQKNTNLRLFEIGKVFLTQQHNIIEKKMLSALLMGKSQPLFWKGTEEIVDFYYVKGILEELFLFSGLSIEFKKEKQRYKIFSDVYYESIFLNKEYIGCIGSLSNQSIFSFSLAPGKTHLPSIFLFELEMEKIEDKANFLKRYKRLPKYPAVVKDISLLVPLELTHKKIFDKIKYEGTDLLKEIRLFDVYEGQHIRKGYRSLSYTLVYRSDTKTLTEEEVNLLHQKILYNLSRDLKVEVRKR